MHSLLPGKPASALVLGLILLVMTSSVGAIMGDIDLGVAIDLEDENGIYVATLAQNLGFDTQLVLQWCGQCPDTDDLAVILFLHEATGKSPAYFQVLRGQGLGWWEISRGMGLEPDEWFFPLTTTPRPPYEDMYRKMKADGGSGQALILSDGECRDLVAARYLHRFFEVSQARAMELRATGRNLSSLFAEEFRRSLAKPGGTGEKLAGNAAKS